MKTDANRKYASSEWSVFRPAILGRAERLNSAVLGQSRPIVSLANE